MNIHTKREHLQYELYRRVRNSERLLFIFENPGAPDVSAALRTVVVVGALRLQLKSWWRKHWRK